MLNFAKLESGSVHFNIRPVEIYHFLSTVEALVGPQMKSRDITYSIAGCDETLTAEADADKLRQIVVNLLSNAAKFTEPGGSITVSAAAREELVEIRVADTGIGIPADKLAPIFEPFVQLDRDSGKHGGVGLGLAISRDLARQMGGDLTAESEVGGGSVFTIQLVRSASTPASAAGKRPIVDAPR